MNKKFFCPHCNKEFFEGEHNFSVEIKYSSDVVHVEGESLFHTDGLDDFLEYGTIYCRTCGNEFDRFDEFEDEDFDEEQEIYWSDLSIKAQNRLKRMGYDNANVEDDIFPIGHIYIGDPDEE